MCLCVKARDIKCNKIYIWICFYEFIAYYVAFYKVMSVFLFLPGDRKAMRKYQLFAFKSLLNYVNKKPQSFWDREVVT